MVHVELPLGEAALAEELSGGDNALWRFGRARLADSKGRADLITALETWQQNVAALGLWHQFGGPPLDKQAQALAFGACHVLLAGARRLDNREMFYNHLQDACRQYHRAWSHTTDDAVRLPNLPGATFELNQLSDADVPKRYLDHLGDHWGESGPAVAMVRSAFAGLMPFTDGHDNLLGEATHAIHLPVLFAAGRGGHGVLTLEWLQRDGNFLSFFPDPIGLGCTTLDHTFSNALAEAWAYARREFSVGGWVRWRISPLPMTLVGGSAGGPLGACLVGLAKRLTFDAGVGFTATLNTKGVLNHVEFIDPKIRAAVVAKTGPHRFVVCRGDEAAHAYLERLFPGVSIRGTDTVEEALPLLTGQMDDLIGEGNPGRPRGYLVGLAERLSELPWHFPRSGAEFFRDLHVQVRVCSRRRDPQELLERERRRRVGQREADTAADELAVAVEKEEPPLQWASANPGGAARDRYPQAVLLGDPGLGKTTLLRYEGWLTATQAITDLRDGRQSLDMVELPIYLRLADLIPVLGENAVDAVTALTTDPKRGGVPVSKSGWELVHRKVQEGKVILLLDALDEIPREQVETVLAWVRGWVTTYPHQRILVTSRHVGYPGTPFPPTGTRPAPELELIAFTPDDVRGFVRGFFGDLTDGPSGVGLADAFIRQLNENSGMLGLCQTPLLLTITCVAFAQRGPGEGLKLPATRCELYKTCLKGLLGGWPRARRTGIQPRLLPSDERTLDRKIELLSRLAWRLACSDPERTLFTRPELEAALEQETELLALLPWQTDQALDALSQHEGVLIAVGEGDAARYLFLHRTFQEYLLAWALGRHPDWRTEALHHVYDPNWIEILVLLGGVLHQQDRQTASAPVFSRAYLYLRSLVLENGNDLLCRPLVRACLAAGELRQVMEPLLDLLSEQLVRWYFSPFKLFRRERVLECLEALHAHSTRHLLNGLKDKDRQVRLLAVKALDFLGQRTPVIIETLLRALDDAEVYVRVAVADALGHLGRGIPAVGEVLLMHEDVSVRYHYVEALESGESSPVVVAGYMHALKDSDRDVRVAAVSALGRAGRGTSAVLEALLQASEEQDNTVRVLATAAIERLCPETPATVEMLLLVLADVDKPWSVRSVAAKALGHVSVGTPALVEGLLHALKDENKSVHGAAAEALGRVGARTPAVIEALRNISEIAGWGSQDVVGAIARHQGQTAQLVEVFLRALKRGGFTYQAAVRVSLNQSRKEPRIIEAILHALEDGSSAAERAVRELGRQGQRTPAVIAVLMNALREEDSSVRSAAAEVIGHLGTGTPTAIAALLDALKDKNEYVRKAAASALGHVGSGKAAVVDALLHALKDESWSGSVRDAAARALGRVGVGTPAVVEALLHALKDERLSVQGAAAEALGRVGVGTPAVVEALLHALKDERLSVQGAAAEALGRVGAGTPAVVDALLHALKDGIWSARGAAEALGRVGVGTPVVVDALLHALKDESLRDFAARALRSVRTGTPALFEVLLRTLAEENATVRSEVTDKMQQPGIPPHEAISPESSPAVARWTRDEFSKLQKDFAELFRE